MGIVKVRDYQQAHWDEPIIFELSTPGVRGIIPPEPEDEITSKVGDVAGRLPSSIRRQDPPALPELDQKRVLSHYLHLSQETLGGNLTPDASLGTCTMKYNPRVHEDLVNEPGLAELHPHQPDETIQGILAIYHGLEQILKEISGMDRFTLQPGGGAHAVFTAASIMRAYWRDKGEADKRTEIITTMFSHPADAASPATAGFDVITLMPTEDGYPDLAALKAVVSERTAGLFITNPEDTGLYNPLIDQFVRVVHEAGGLCFNDQANANPLLGIARAADAGFDMSHFNVHKTFATPHACSGPATGALGVRDFLAKYLPWPTVEQDDERFFLDYERPSSVGKTKGYLGTAPVVLRAFAWCMMMGPDGLREVAEIAVLNNNYLMKQLENIPGLGFPYAKGRRRLEEVRWSWEALYQETGVGTEDIARRIGDFGLQHYFASHHPWVVPQPMTLEPCETFAREELDEYAAVLTQIAQEARDDPELVRTAPHRLAAHKRNDDASLDDPARWATTWRAYRRKQSGA
ncbi:MAG: glycine dehydrogenase subunit 2 [Chloroflexota bacterium]|nr:glycine dehydrogenase subunit 2 [Chloroflexota bacterium]